jgi:hypothetical protein
MPTYYHVSPTDHAIGTTLQPGHFGTFMKQFVKGGGVVPPNIKFCYDLTWEAALETSRILSAPTAPSRLNCIFACTSLEAAILFRDKYRVGAGIFQIKVAEDTPVFTGDLGAISSTKAGMPFLDIWVSAATRYWTDQPGNSAEILIGGTATVIAKA